MNTKEAYEIILSKLKNTNIISCYEYDSLFVFRTIPNGASPSEKIIGDLYSVNKQTGELKSFVPTTLSKEEYATRKEIKDFKVDSEISHCDIGRAFISNLIKEDDELAHYGVLGMKWGVRRSLNKASRSTRLEKKALKYDKKAEKAFKKGEKQHSEYDLGRANKAAKKASKQMIKSTKYQKKALKTDNEYLKDLYEKRAAKKAYKGAKYRRDANRLSRTTGYGVRAAATMAKGDKYKQKAAKARYKLNNDKYYITKMQKKYSSIPNSEIKMKRELVDRFLDL